VPIVDRVVVLDTRIGTSPRGLGDLAEELLGLDRLHRVPVRAGGQIEVVVPLDGAQEGIAQSHRVVRILVLDRGHVLSIEIHVEARVAQHSDLLLFTHFRLDKFADIRVVDVQHHHLRRAPGGSTGLDRACARIRATHEGHGAARGPAGREEFRRRTDAR